MKQDNRRGSSVNFNNIGVWSQHQSNDFVRVDFFVPSGKWYTTEQIVWDFEFYSGNIIENYKTVLMKHLTTSDSVIRLLGMRAVCLEPHHENPCPLMITII